ncbi:YdbC family protein [Neobacillus vireti]|uniref:YdbC family protein n=1 Tax=Neobacillus vireti TaxID=220686 RepID=UPI0030004204
MIASLKYEIIETIGVISEGAKGWNKELNLISWNDREPKYDLRDWDQNHEKMGKGITLSQEELIQLRDLMNGLKLE